VTCRSPIDGGFVDETGRPEGDLDALMHQRVGRLEGIHAIDGRAYPLHDPSRIEGGI